jgi:hypothetical protein
MTPAVVALVGLGLLAGGLGGCKQEVESRPSAEEAISAAASRSVAREGVAWPEPPDDGAPVGIHFDSLVSDSGSTRAKMRLYNFAERDVSLVELELVYRDQQGNTLNTFPWRATPALPARSHALHVVGAFLPEKTTRVDAKVTAVRFDDGSRWPAQTKP